MATWGNNPTALREVANMCGWGADITELRIQILERAIDILQASAFGSWVGPYIAMLRRVIKVLQRVLALLQEYTKMLNSNAAEQDQASGTHAGSRGAGGGAGRAGSGQAGNVLRDLTDMFNAGEKFLNALNKDPQPAATDPAAPGTPQTGRTPAESEPPAVPAAVDTPASTPEDQPPGGRAATPAPGAGGTDPTGARQASPHTGGGGLDAGSPLDRTAVAQDPGQGAVLSRSPLVGPQGAVLAATPESGAVKPDSMALGDRATGLPTGVLAGALAGGAGLGMWAARKNTDKADNTEPNLTA